MASSQSKMHRCRELLILMNVLPPKRAFFSSQMRNYIMIVIMPYETHPLHISFPIEFIKLLQEKSIVLNGKINHTKTPLALWPLSPSQILLVMQRILRLLSRSLEMKETSLIVSIFPCPELHTMNFFSYNNTLIHSLPLIDVRMTLGGSFVGIRFIPLVNIISINSKT
jgi:hypothetical protein